MQSILYPATVTVLGIGNVILRDEGFGVRVAEYLDSHYEFPDDVQIIDGGTLGIELTQYVTGCQKLLVIDSINGGKTPGTVFRFHNDAVMAHFQDKLSAHEVGIQDVLAFLQVTGHAIPEVVVIGAQPYDVEAGVGLSTGMKKILPNMVEQALKELSAWGITATKKANVTELTDTVVAEEAVKETVEKCV